jgi:hypothetical protein
MDEEIRKRNIPTMMPSMLPATSLLPTLVDYHR